MVIAVFMDHTNFEKLCDGIKEVFLFHVQDSLITGIGNETVSIHHIDYILLWLLGKQVETIYADKLEERLIIKLKRADIEVKPLDIIRSNPFLKSFLIP